MASSCDADELFRLFTLPASDFFKSYLIIDLRDVKQFSKGHLNQAFCVRLSSNGKVLADYSKSEYQIKWSQDLWVGRTVFVYGEAGLKKDHPAVAFLSGAGCKAVKYYREGYDALAKAYPCICTTSVKANIRKEYPSQIVPGLLYLGDWSHAENTPLLADLNIKAIVTIHNHPENLKGKLGKGVRWLPWELPDVETADITPTFNTTFEFIEEARHRKEAVLVHCGAGVSRSATLCMMYLMRRFSYNAQKAKEVCAERRPVVCPNDGFWRTLCALEPQLGITSRSDPEAGTGFKGDDWQPPSVGSDAVGGKVQVRMVEAAALKRERVKEEEGGEAADRDAKRARTAGVGRPSAVTVTLEVDREGTLIGQLVVGPIKPHQKVIFGRLPSCDIVAEHGSISRQHAAISLDPFGTLLLTDLQSGHGTKLDDTWLRPNAAKPLKQGSVIRLGASARAYKVQTIEKHS